MTLASEKKIFYQNNTQQVQLYGVKDETTGLFWTTGTITATLYDQNGNQVAGLIGIPLTLQAGGLGNYFGTVTATFKPDVGDGFILMVDGDQGASHLHLEIPVEVRARKS